MAGPENKLIDNLIIGDFYTLDRLIASNNITPKALNVAYFLDFDATKDAQDPGVHNNGATDTSQVFRIVANEGLDIYSVPFLQRVAEGLEPGYSSIFKYGDNPDVTGAEDLWDKGGDYTFSTEADIDQIVSDNPADTVEMYIEGLDGDFNEVVQLVTLNGTTPVTLATPLKRFYRGFNYNGEYLLGTVTVYVNGGSPTVAADVRGQITAEHQQTMMCIYTIPAGKTGYFYGGYIGLADPGAVAQTGKVALKVRLEDKIFLTKASVELNSQGVSIFDPVFRIPLKIPEKSDILLRVLSVSTNCALDGGFTILLKENT